MDENKKILWLITIVLLATSCNISNHNESAIDENVLDENATQFEILYEEDLEGQLKKVSSRENRATCFCIL